MAFQCYYEFSTSGGPVEHPGMGPCGQGDNPDNIQCCGINEMCMSDGICAYSKLDPGGSGFYIGGCTDSTMQDPRCPRNCTSFANSDVVYNYDIGQWMCCAGNETYARNCSFMEWSKPAGNAPPPVELLYVATILATGSSLPLAPRVSVISASTGSLSTGSSTTGSPVTSAASAATVTVTLPSNGIASRGLSAGASAGIAVAAMLVLIAAIATGFWISVYHQRRRQRVRPVYTGVRTVQPQMTPLEKSATFSPQLLPTTSPQAFRNSDVSQYELSSGSQRTR